MRSCSCASGGCTLRDLCALPRASPGRVRGAAAPESNQPLGVRLAAVRGTVWLLSMLFTIRAWSTFAA